MKSFALVLILLQSPGSRTSADVRLEAIVERVCSTGGVYEAFKLLGRFERREGKFETLVHRKRLDLAKRLTFGGVWPKDPNSDLLVDAAHPVFPNREDTLDKIQGKLAAAEEDIRNRIPDHADLGITRYVSNHSLRIITTARNHIAIVDYIRTGRLQDPGEQRDETKSPSSD